MSSSNPPIALRIAGPLLLAIGLVIAALVIAGAIRDFRLADRFVEVKGFAEREVMADLAIWPIQYQLAGSSLDEVRESINQADEAIIAFLKLRGFEDAEISRNPPRINDHWLYTSGDQRPANRFSVERGITLRTDRVAATRSALEQAADLIGEGIILAPDWGQSAQFLFTGLEAIKPAMIADATADARRAASQFAADSEARIGPIRSARQGFFSINERDPSTPEVKVVRVVTTIEYVLE
ncbi:MAG: SIMPL domain-containing protein [Wenzhouxiangella sp.]